MTEEILLVGAGGHCTSCIDVIEAEGRYRIAAIVDRGKPAGSTLLGYPVVGGDEQIAALAGSIPNALVAVGHVGNPEPRLRIFARLREAGYRLPTIVSPRAHVSRHATVGPGSIIMHDALVNANASVGANCIVNTKALIEHDAVVEDHCHISTGAIVNGNARIGEASFYGSGAVCKEGALVPPGSFVKANSIRK